MNTLASVRARYAQAMAPHDARIRATFSAVPRERFAGAPPWRLLGGRPALDSVRDTSDPAELYQDALVVLDAGKGLNNGSPSLHAHMLALLDVQPTDHVLHVGTGGGYYTAILAELAARVTAIEFDPALAAASRANLAPWPHVRVEQGDGAAWPREAVQRIYVNFAIARPAEAWLDHLAPGGVLLAPLGVPDPAETTHATGRAALLVVTRTPRGFAATFDWDVGFVFAEGTTAGDAALRLDVWQALGRGGRGEVRSLLRGPADPQRCWLVSPGFSLSRDPP